MEELIVPAVHSEHVTKLPKGSKCLGSSERTKNEINNVIGDNIAKFVWIDQLHGSI